MAVLRIAVLLYPRREYYIQGILVDASYDNLIYSFTLFFFLRITISHINLKDVLLNESVDIFDQSFTILFNNVFTSPNSVNSSIVGTFPAIALMALALMIFQSAIKVSVRTLQRNERKAFYPVLTEDLIAIHYLLVNPQGNQLFDSRNQ
jgi:hypothetical protein